MEGTKSTFDSAKLIIIKEKISEPAQ